MGELLRDVLSDDRGQAIAEYAMILALISIVAIAALNSAGKHSSKGASGTIVGGQEDFGWLT
jgi:Flp pilus assembly pilin Flp